MKVPAGIKGRQTPFGKNLRSIEESAADYVLILSGDQLIE